MPRKNDPLAILGDLEIDLMFSFLSVPETVVIRRVSMLWKARVEFRLTSGAIRHHYPTTASQIPYEGRCKPAPVLGEKNVFAQPSLGCVA